MVRSLSLSLTVVDFILYFTKTLLRSYDSPSSLVYHRYDANDVRYDPNFFDEFDQPPPVHIIYPRPNFNQLHHSHGYGAGYGAAGSAWPVGVALVLPPLTVLASGLLWLLPPPS